MTVELSICSKCNKPGNGEVNNGWYLCPWCRIVQLEGMLDSNSNPTDKPLDPRHAHLALMAAMLEAGLVAKYGNRMMEGVRSSAIRRAREILAEVEAQYGE